MKVALMVFALAVIGALFIVAGIAQLWGLPPAMITAGIFVFVAAARLQSVVTPRG